MTIYAWPTSGKPFTPIRSSVGSRPNQRVSVSTLNGATQSVSLPGARWVAMLDFPVHTYPERSQLEGFLNRLSGMEHRLSLWDHRRPTPRGTCSVGGVTASAAAQFATTVVLNGCGVSTTLLQGDWIGLTTSTGAQVVQVTADFTATAGGVMSLTDGIRPMLRGSVAGASAVVLTRPSSLFLIEDEQLVIPYGPQNLCPEFTLQLMEVFS